MRKSDASNSRANRNHPGGVKPHRDSSLVGRAVFSVFVVTAYLTLVVDVVAFATLVASGVRPWFGRVAVVLLAPALALDVSSAYMHVAYLLGRATAHGQAALSWFFYLAFILLALQTAWWGRVSALAGFTVFHACCQYYVPLCVATKLGWRPNPGEFPSWHVRRKPPEGSDDG